MRKFMLILAVAFCFMSGVFVGKITSKSTEISSNTYPVTTKEAEVLLLQSKEQNLETMVDRAIESYKEFLTGTRNAGDWDINTIIIPTGEPERRYFTKYAFFDSNSDGIPELHIKSARQYIVFTFKNDEIVIWSSLSPYVEPLNNGAYLFTRCLFAGIAEAHSYVMLDYYGKEVLKINFSIVDTNQNGVNDEGDEYWFCEAGISKETYDILTKPYMTIGSDLIEWIVLCENQ